MMDFSQALIQLKLGAMLFRAGWNGRNQWIKFQSPDLKSKMSLPYLYIKTSQGELVPWVASQSDLLASDWFVLDPGRDKVKK